MFISYQCIITPELHIPITYTLFIGYIFSYGFVGDMHICLPYICGRHTYMFQQLYALQYLLDGLPLSFMGVMLHGKITLLSNL